MWETLATGISAVVGIAGLFVGWRAAREATLRREDVLTWSNEVIHNLESLLLVCDLKDPPLDAAVAKAKLTEIMFDTAVLVERGRLFFKNEIRDQHGSEKQPAYQGYRPEILDQIVVAHQIARAFASADEESRLRMRLIAEDILRRFVSLAQKEVGRGRTVSVDTSKGGDGGHLPWQMQRVDPRRLAGLRRAGN